MRLAAAFALAALLQISAAQASAWLRFDYGGDIEDRVKQMELFDLMGGTFRIEGECDSACTMYLSLKHVCVAPNTVLGFHSATITGGPHRGKMSAEGNLVVEAHLPPAVRDWALRKHAFKSTTIVPMTAETAWSLGVRKCL